MPDSIKDPRELQSIYERRFSEANAAYRQRVWEVLVRDYFQRFVSPEASVLDLGCGYGEFINAVVCGQKHGMDLNPRSREHLNPDVTLHQCDCSQTWPLPDECLNVVFTSNFFEHLPDKLALKKTLFEARRCLKPGGIIIALGPNIRCIDGAYWDFWDHFLCLTERSLTEALENNGYEVTRATARFLPYTTIDQPAYPMWMIRLYLALPAAWLLLGKQFLVIARKQ